MFYELVNLRLRKHICVESRKYQTGGNAKEWTSFTLPNHQAFAVLSSHIQTSISEDTYTHARTHTCTQNEHDK